MDKAANAHSNSIDSRIDQLLAIRQQLAQKEEHFYSTFGPDSLSALECIFRQINGKGKRILEIGSGYGFGSIVLALMGASEVHGVDIVKSAVESADEIKRKVAPDLSVYFKHHDAVRGVPYPDSSFDAVLMIEVLSHMIANDMRSVLAEVVRVLDRGGRFLLSDGNNAHSPLRRRANYRIWDHFERGPKMSPGETYVETRKRLALEAVPSLSQGEAQQIAERTFRYLAREVRDAARLYARTEELPNSPCTPKQCPIDPVNEIYIEQLIEPMEVAAILRQLGCKIVSLRPRRDLPLGALFNAIPHLSLLVSNGFLLIAEKK